MQVGVGLSTQKTLELENNLPLRQIYTGPFLYSDALRLPLVMLGVHLVPISCNVSVVSLVRPPTPWPPVECFVLPPQWQVGHPKLRGCQAPMPSPSSVSP